MRVALRTRLQPGREPEYERAHRAVPPELVEAIRSAGVRDWTIWRSGLDLFHLVDVENYAAMLAALQRLPVNVAWQARVNELLDVSHDYCGTGADRGLPVVWELRDA